MKTIKIEGTLRTDTGKKATKSLRKDGMVPCVIYSEGQENIHFYAPVSSFKHLIYTPSFCKANIILEGNTYEAILKDAQFHPVTENLLHIDFLTLIPGKPVSCDVPVRIVGRAIGVMNGGKLINNRKKLKIRALPAHLTDYIEVDVTNLELNKTIKVGELNEALDDIEILNPDTIPVVSVITPRVLVTAADVEEDEDEMAEGEGGAEGAEGTEAAAEGSGEQAAEAAGESNA